jgi:MtaA/CmuA family methyltransferase
MKAAMSSKHRFLAALLGGPVDRIPVGNVVSVATVDLMEMARARFPDAHLDAGAMAALATAGHTVLGFDTVMPVFSVVQEASALGCEIDWGHPTMMPAVMNHPFAEAADLAVPDAWFDRPSIQVVLEALTQLRRTLGDRVVIVGKVMGPWSLSYHMMGTERFLLNTILEPQRVRRSLAVLKDVSIAFIRAQVQAGADVVCIADHATGDMVSARMYRDFLLPVHQEIMGAVGCPMILHCCGNTGDRVASFAETGIACYHLESRVDLPKAVQDTGGKMTLMGNINNPELLLSGTPQAVVEACERAVCQGIDILSPECAVPLHTPVENLRALVDFAQAHPGRAH